MNQPINTRHFYLLAIISLILNGITWGIAVLFPRHESATILHYTSSVGIDFVGEGRHIIVLPAAGALVLVLNLLVGRIIANTDERTAWILWSTVPVIQIILGASLIFLLSLNR